MGLLRAGCGWLLAWPRWLAGALAALWILALHAGSWIPKEPQADVPSFAEIVLYNWMHFPAYASLAAWLALAQRRESGLPLPIRVLLVAFCGALLVGLSDEVHQSTVPWRQADPVDLLTDALAASGALWFLAGASAGRPERVLLLRGCIAAVSTLASAALAAARS